jgi:hypothetical protein
MFACKETDVRESHRTTALPLAGKGRVVAEKRSTRSTVKVPFLPWLNTLYIKLLRPVATYGAETWTLTVTDENVLRMFERKIIHRIYVPVMENNVWRIRCNEELNTF